METNGMACRSVITIKESVIIVRCNEFCLTDKKQPLKSYRQCHVITLERKYRCYRDCYEKIQFRADATNGNPTCEIETVARNAHKTVTEKKKKRKAHHSLSIHKLLCQIWFQYVERKYERERERKGEGRRRERQCELRVAWIKWRSRVRGTNAFNVNPNISLSTWKKKCRQRA